MKKPYFYKFFWEDGTITICRGYDRTEMYWEVKKHGKLIKKERAW